MTSLYRPRRQTPLVDERDELLDAGVAADGQQPQLVDARTTLGQAAGTSGTVSAAQTLCYRVGKLQVPCRSVTDPVAHRIKKIVSGGQTGVDRAALDVALALGMDCGGWCPHGRKAEDGTIAPIYLLQETPSADCAQRTEWNVRDSDGTLILTRGQLMGGTALTLAFVTEGNKPWLVIDLLERHTGCSVYEWVQQHEIEILNIAGPRESQQPGIYAEAAIFLAQVLG